VRYVIAFDAGSSPDIVGRVTERLSRLWGREVVVANRVGAVPDGSANDRLRQGESRGRKR
jgi:hypothetical protein